MDPKYTADSENITFLDPNVIVFHNVIDNCDGLIDYYEENAPWTGWYGFGRQVDARGPRVQGRKPFPTWEEWKADIIDEYGDPITEEEVEYRTNVASGFYWATKFYVEQTNIELPNWHTQAWSLARYIPDEDLIGNDDLTMNFHTDYQPNDSESPGQKFGITAVFYPNDDYEGGEIAFRYIENEEVAKEFSYKPKAGDLIIFPAKFPYYHAVRRVWGSPKYIIRLYWSYDFEGTEEWFRLRDFYGAEKFKELEAERLRNGKLMIMDPYMRSRFSISEYYSMLEGGTLSSVLEKIDRE